MFSSDGVILHREVRGVDRLSHLDSISKPLSVIITHDHQLLMGNQACDLMTTLTHHVFVLPISY